MSEETKDFQIEVKSDSGKKGDVTVSFNGSFGISNASSIKQEMAGIEVKGSQYTLNFEYVDDIDLSFIQIILAWSRSKISSKSRVSYKWNITDDLKQLVQHGGFKQLLQI